MLSEKSIKRYKPTKDESLFLVSYLNRKLGDTLENVCVSAGLSVDWFQTKKRNKMEFLDWFITETQRRKAITLLELTDLLTDQIRQSADSGAAINPKTLQTLIQALQPQNFKVEVETRIAPMTVAETREAILEYLEGICQGRRCKLCGGPLVNWPYFTNVGPARVEQITGEEPR